MIPLGLPRGSSFERDFDILHQINKTAILPDDLSNRLTKGVIVSFSFSTLQDEVAQIFEKGATLPSKRLNILEKTVKEGFLTGVSLMPLLPFISDTTEQLELFFSTFTTLKVDYILPATITLFGHGKSDSKTLVLNAIRKHYPHLEKRYISYFKTGSEMPDYYKNAFAKKMKELAEEFSVKDWIEKK